MFKTPGLFLALFLAFLRVKKEILALVRAKITIQGLKYAGKCYAFSFCRGRNNNLKDLLAVITSPNTLKSVDIVEVMADIKSWKHGNSLLCG